jgi:hypothetical protein
MKDCHHFTTGSERDSRPPEMFRVLNPFGYRMHVALAAR